MRQLSKLFLRAFCVLMPTTAARWIGRRMMTPYRVPSVKAFPKAEVTRTRVPYAHGWLFVRVWGEGPPVLLVHGWGGKGENLGAVVDPLVEAGFRVVAYDAPAHGESSGERTSMIECAGAALQICGRFGPFHGVIAHSFGAPTAALAASHGLKSERFVFLGAPLSVMDLMIDMAVSLGATRHACELMVRGFETRLRFRRDELRTDRLVEKISAPILVVHDRQDKMVPMNNGAAIAAAAPSGSLLETNGLGHRGVLTDPDVVSAVVAFVLEEAPIEDCVMSV